MNNTATQNAKDFEPVETTNSAGITIWRCPCCNNRGAAPKIKRANGRPVDSGRKGGYLVSILNENNGEWETKEFPTIISIVKGDVPGITSEIQVNRLLKGTFYKKSKKFENLKIERNT